jgi:dTDP-4-dehydrorhamnose reductase
MSTETRPRFVVTGAAGQVGRALLSHWGDRAMGCARSQLDLAGPDALSRIERVLDEWQPSLLINAAAFTQVDQAEKEEETARRVNAAAPGAMARWCARRQIPFVHISTDYVFSGAGSVPWREEDPTGPLSAYGRTKLEGEREVSQAGGRWVILRTSWVYDAAGKNFLNTILKLAQERTELRIVSDQIGAPTYAGHFARALAQVAERVLGQASIPTGTYHLCHQGETSWHGFATEIVTLARGHGIPLQAQTLKAIPSSEYPTPAKRPLNSRLNMEKIKRDLGISLPDWKEGLRDCLNDRQRR